jgi:hypothetical protein
MQWVHSKADFCAERVALECQTVAPLPPFGYQWEVGAVILIKIFLTGFNPKNEGLLTGIYF